MKKPETPIQTPMQRGSNHRKSHTHHTDPTGKHWLPVQLGCDRLNQSVDIITEQAGYLFYNSEYKNCIDVLDELSPK